jgi:hypothetical protein
LAGCVVAGVASVLMGNFVAASAMINAPSMLINRRKAMLRTAGFFNLNQTSRESENGTPLHVDEEFRMTGAAEDF